MSAIAALHRLVNDPTLDALHGDAKLSIRRKKLSFSFGKSLTIALVMG